MDFKPTILLTATFFIDDINLVLKTSALILNVGYVSYQLYTHHKKQNTDDKK